MKDKQKQIIAEQKQIIAEIKEKIFSYSEILEKLSMLLANTIELRDPYTKGHSEHVSEITSNIVKLMFPEKYPNVTTVKIAGLIHDIGKIGINENILNKPTILTEAEFIMIKHHTVLGEKLIKPLALGSLWCEAILYHHENFDGSGYPYGLKGEQIPLIARIIRIADVFDALTSQRPYREALKLEKAFEIMKKNHNHFDPEIFEFFLKNLNRLTKKF